MLPVAGLKYFTKCLYRPDGQQALLITEAGGTFDMPGLHQPDFSAPHGMLATNGLCREDAMRILFLQWRNKPHDSILILMFIPRIAMERSPPVEMVEAVVAAGFVSLGFRAMPVRDMTPICYERVRRTTYIRDVLALRDEYQGQLRIWLGVELDRFARADRSQYHYILGAAHYIQSGDRYISVDGNIDALDHARKHSTTGTAWRWPRSTMTQWPLYT